MRIYFFLLLIILATEPCFSQYYSNRYFGEIYRRQDCQEPKGFFQKLFSYFNRNLKACSKSYFNEQLINPSREAISPIIENPSVSLDTSATSLVSAESLRGNFQQTRLARLETIEEEENFFETTENDPQNVAILTGQPNLLANAVGSTSPVDSIGRFTVEDTISEASQVIAPFTSDIACLGLTAVFVPVGLILGLEKIYSVINKDNYKTIDYTISNENGIICKGEKNINLKELKENGGDHVIFEHNCSLERNSSYRLKISVNKRDFLERKYVVTN